MSLARGSGACQTNSSLSKLESCSLACADGYILRQEVHGVVAHGVVARCNENGTLMLPSPDICAEDAVIRQNRTVALQAVQSQSLPWLLIFGGCLVALNVVTASVSKCVFKDENANYLSMVQCSLSVFDMVSDIVFLHTLHQSDNWNEFANFYYVGLAILLTSALLNASVPMFVIRQEIQRKNKSGKQELGQWFQEHPVATCVCLFLSLCKANFIIMLDTHLFISRTQTFNAPLPQKLRTKLRVYSCGHLVLEDCAQSAIVLTLQLTLLYNWTPLNTITLSLSLLALGVAAGSNVYQLYKSYQWKKTKNMQSQSGLELKVASVQL